MDWRQIQKTNFTKIDELAKFLEINPPKNPSSFPLNLPIRLARKINKRDPQDPILKQFFPSDQETNFPPSLLQDPVCDVAFQKTGKLLKKYAKRALILTTSACAMHCRFCFRQNYPYETKQSPHPFKEELALIEKDHTLNEVILSGGDPLSLSDAVLARLIDALNEISHITLLRFHTRFPIGIPERISEDFLEILQRFKGQIIFSLHINHHRELDRDILNAMKNIQALQIPILSQTVLLREVNDNVETLSSLFTELIENGIIPYYLHQLDPIAQGHDFAVSKRKGHELIKQLREILPGYAIPTYVEEVPFEKSKTPITSSRLF